MKQQKLYNHSCGIMVAHHNFGNRKDPDYRTGVLITMEPPIKEKYNKGYTSYPVISNTIEGLFVPIFNGVSCLSELEISMKNPKRIQMKYQDSGKPEIMKVCTFDKLYEKKLAVYTAIEKKECKCIIFSKDDYTFFETNGKKNYYPLYQVNKWRISFSFYEPRREDSNFATVGFFYYGEQVGKFSI